MDIAGHPNYIIYKDGRIFSKDRQTVNLKGVVKFYKSRQIKWSMGNIGYYRVNLGRKNAKTVHRLIAIHYIPNPNNYKLVDHINRDRSDNRIENLRWCTRQMNQVNMSKRKTNLSGHKNIHFDARKVGWIFTITRKGLHHSKLFKTIEECISYKREYLTDLGEEFI